MLLNLILLVFMITNGTITSTRRFLSNDNYQLGSIVYLRIIMNTLSIPSNKHTNKPHMAESLENHCIAQSIIDPLPSLLLVSPTIWHSSWIYESRYVILNTLDEEYCIQTNLVTDRTDSLRFICSWLSTFHHQSTEEFHFVITKINEIWVVDSIQHGSTKYTISISHSYSSLYGSISVIFVNLLGSVDSHLIHSLMSW